MPSANKRTPPHPPRRATRRLLQQTSRRRPPRPQRTASWCELCSSTPPPRVGLHINSNGWKSQEGGQVCRVAGVVRVDERVGWRGILNCSPSPFPAFFLGGGGGIFLFCLFARFVRPKPLRARGRGCEEGRTLSKSPIPLLSVWAESFLYPLLCFPPPPPPTSFHPSAFAPHTFTFVS